jgi:hypothetical protein
MKILNFFLYLWVIFALLDPDLDPATHINADPDQQPCQKVVRFEQIIKAEFVGKDLQNNISCCSLNFCSVKSLFQRI